MKGARSVIPMEFPFFSQGLSLILSKLKLPNAELKASVKFIHLSLDFSTNIPIGYMTWPYVWIQVAMSCHF